MGSSITLLGVLTDVRTGQGQWDIYYADMSITSTDGTVRPINLTPDGNTGFQNSDGNGNAVRCHSFPLE